MYNNIYLDISCTFESFILLRRGGRSRMIYIFHNSGWELVIMLLVYTLNILNRELHVEYVSQHGLLSSPRIADYWLLCKIPLVLFWIESYNLVFIALALIQNIHRFIWSTLKSVDKYLIYNYQNNFLNLSKLFWGIWWYKTK